MDWTKLTTQQLIEMVRNDPCATERDLVLVEKLATLTDELDDMERQLHAARSRP